MQFIIKQFANLRRCMLSCALLFLPIFVWNALFTRNLPAAWSTTEFWHDIPATLAQVEDVFRLIISVLPFFMPLELTSVIQRRGLIVYGVGTGLYYASWPSCWRPTLDCTGDGAIAGRCT